MRRLVEAEHPRAGGVVVPGAFVRDPAATARPHQDRVSIRSGRRRTRCTDRVRAAIAALLLLCRGCATGLRRPACPTSPVLEALRAQALGGHAQERPARHRPGGPQRARWSTWSPSFGVGATADPKGEGGAGPLRRAPGLPVQAVRGRPAGTGTCSSGWAASFNASTTSDFTNYYTIAHKDHLKTADAAGGLAHRWTPSTVSPRTSSRPNARWSGTSCASAGRPRSATRCSICCSSRCIRWATRCAARWAAPTSR